MENFFKNKRYVNKEIKVKFVTTLSELSTCNMLFIPSAKKNVTEKLIKHSLKSSIIIITEENTDKSKGSCINFSEKNGKLSIEINKEEMTNRKIIMNQALEPYFIK